ncbi:hypothetical protein STEG23_011976 [Scotinomys teguina]
MEQTMRSEENSKTRRIPGFAAGAKVPRLHARPGSQNSEDMTPALPSDLGSEKKKGLGFGVAYSKLCWRVANTRSAQKR